MYNYVVAIKKKQVGEIIMLVKQKIIIYNMKNPQGEIQNRLRSGHYWDIYIHVHKQKLRYTKHVAYWAAVEYPRSWSKNTTSTANS